MQDNWRLVKRETDELYDISKDPGQRNNLAEDYPDVVKDLYAEYDQWWNENAPEPDWYAEIIVGSEYENPTTLFSHDSYSRQGKRIWVINAARDGKYEIKLNRWPEESGKRIVENRNGDNEVPIVNAELIVGSINLHKEVTSDMTSAVFTVNLKAGTNCIQTTLHLEKGKTSRTDCVYVKYLGEAEPGSLDNYKSSDPDEILRKNFKQKPILFD